jgi:asparagine synthase (glutamine-hydrolysing)
MKCVAISAPLGVHPVYYREDKPCFAGRIKDIVLEPRWDEQGVRQYLCRRPDGERTCFEHVRMLRAESELWRDENGWVIKKIESPVVMQKPVLDLLTKAVQRILEQADHPILCLSGGLDSALLLRLCQKIGVEIPVCTLCTRIDGYCEGEQTLLAARELGVRDVMVVKAGLDDFVSVLPEAIAAMEVPIYNLHPVSKLVLAQALRKRGFKSMITGDGADQVFAGSDARNYLPLVGTLVRSAGMELHSPFFDPNVTAAGRQLQNDPTKAVLRHAASGVLPKQMVWTKKVPRLMPDLNLDSFWDKDTVQELSEYLKVPLPEGRPGPERTLWTTLGLLGKQMRRE